MIYKLRNQPKDFNEAYVQSKDKQTFIDLNKDAEWGGADEETRIKALGEVWDMCNPCKVDYIIPKSLIDAANDSAEALDRLDKETDKFIGKPRKPKKNELDKGSGENADVQP